MLGDRVYGYVNDTDTISGTVTAVGGRFGDIRAVLWDDGVTTYVGDLDLGISWDYED
ncbi:hypothetical protein ACGFZB_28845 [Streptomyces cinerochromogenes]|uniref:Uncharacterized protein n=1 Tax=Streptomyces cinerochromogenes TaxID=66422 RepID=A0ABW7BAX7_9ACTN